MPTLTIGQLARLGEVNLETIRFYERQGLLSPPPRSPSGYRAFPEKSVQQIRFIRRAQQLGFSLAEVRQLLSLRAESSRDCKEVCRQAAQKLQEVESKIDQLQAMRRALQRLTRSCSGNRLMRDCGILESLDKNGAK